MARMRASMGSSRSGNPARVTRPPRSSTYPAKASSENVLANRSSPIRRRVASSPEERFTTSFATSSAASSNTGW